MDFPFTYQEHLEGRCIIEIDGEAKITAADNDWEDNGWMIDGLALWGAKNGTEYDLIELPPSHHLYLRIKRWLLGNHYRDIDQNWSGVSAEAVS